MKLRTVLAWIAGLAILVGGASSAHAQEIQKQADSGGVTGKVLRVTPSDGTITVIGPNGENGIYWTDAKTTIMNGSKTVRLADIQPGWTVTVTYDQTVAKLNATYIEVVDTPKAGAP